MFQRLTDRARKVMALANQEALRLNHEHIGTEHILLGLVKEGSGVGANVLKNLNIDLRKVRIEVEKLVKTGPGMVSLGKLPQTPAAKKVIECSIAESGELNHNYVGTEHLLLGLLREHDGVAAQVLTNLGLKIEEVREELLSVLRAEAESKEAPPQAEPQERRAVSAHRADPDPSEFFSTLTDRARKMLALANQEAQRLNHEYIGTEHILLGLVKEGSGVGANVLKNLDIDLRKVRIEVEKLVKTGPEMVTMGKLPQTPRAKKVIEYAIEEARNLNHNYVGTEHLLLGLLREHDGVAAQVLMNLGLKLEEVREEVLNLLGAGAESEEFPSRIALLVARLADALRADPDPSESASTLTEHAHRLLALARLEAGLLDRTGPRGALSFATVGLMTRSAPDALQTADIAYAIPHLLELLPLGTHESITVRYKHIIMTGELVKDTDQLIARSGEFWKEEKGWTLLISAGEARDSGANIPSIDARMVEALHAAGGGAIAVGAGKVILRDKPTVLATAERLGVAIVGI